MKKEEFPTFLNEQPTVVFGRTTRELLIIACGLTVAYTLWSNLNSLLPSPWGMVVAIISIVITLIASLVIAMIPVASRSLEEWIVIWLFYLLEPKLYLFKPLDVEETAASSQFIDDEAQLQQHAGSDALDED